MSCYTKYLLKKLEEAGAETIFINHVLVDKEGNMLWLVDFAPGYKKCSMLGYGTYIRRYVSSTKSVHMHAILLEDNWKSCGRDVFGIDEIDACRCQTLESFFFQLMAIAEKQHVYLNGEKLFEKGSSCQHLMLAELMS